MNVIQKIKLLLGSSIGIIKTLPIRGIKDTISVLYANIKVCVKPSYENYSLWHKLNMDFLRREITIDHNIKECGKIDKVRIWTLWWQGDESMPFIIKNTIKSIRNATEYEVVLITKDNYMSYIELPDAIINKLDRISLPHLSDYIRVALLAKYGGLWIDSTVFCSDRIPEFVFNSSFYTIRNLSNQNKYIAKGKWNMQVMGTNIIGCPVFILMKRFLEEYWSKFDRPINYLFFDCYMNVLYEDNKTFKDLIDSVPVTNKNMHSLLPILNEEYSDDCYQKLKRNTFFFKLTYKLNYLRNINQNSYYAKFFRN